MAGIKALVVESHERSRDALADLLGDEGYEVERLGSGKEAIALAQDAAFDIAFIDLHLSDVDGFEVVRNIREVCPECCCIAIGSGAIVTGHDGPVVVDQGPRALEAGAVAYLKKPIDAEALFDLIDQNLG